MGVMYQRHLDGALREHWAKRKEVLVLLGARQVGKSTILKKLFPNALFLGADVEPIRIALEKFDQAVYRQLLTSGVTELVLDEVHLLSDPGRAVKIFYDYLPGVKLAVTGSSSFSIKNRASESLAGRKIEYHLYPLTLPEYLQQKGIREGNDFPAFAAWAKERTYPFDLKAIIDHLLIYGLYPVLESQPRDTAYLKNLSESVIFKDLLDLSLIENRVAAAGLLKLLAFQIGSLVNYSELAVRLNINVRTVRRYMEIFEQSFIIFTLSPFSRRKRLEVTKMPKIYFWDTGLRNALIDDFSSIHLRPDAGSLWENFVAAEINKANYYGDFGYKLHFWRTAQGSEIDLVLEKKDELLGIEIKSAGGRVNLAFKNRYPEAKMFVVTKNNFL